MDQPTDDDQLGLMALMERISGYPMPEAARAAISVQVEAIYRQEGRQWRASLGAYACPGQGAS
jgi:hypothetical protein